MIIPVSEAHQYLKNGCPSCGCHEMSVQTEIFVERIADRDFNYTKATRIKEDDVQAFCAKCRTRVWTAARGWEVPTLESSPPSVDISGLTEKPYGDNTVGGQVLEDEPDKHLELSEKWRVFEDSQGVKST